MLPELYLHGLSKGDFELALRGLLGEGAPLSPSSMERLRASWQGEYDAWRARSLEERELVYLWADGVYVKAGLEQERAALLVVIGALRDGRKEVLAVVPGYRESTESWLGVFRDLRDRGLASPKPAVADGNAAAWAAVAQGWPEAQEQRCWNHKIVNMLDQLPRKLQGLARPLLCAIPYAPPPGRRASDGERVSRGASGAPIRRRWRAWRTTGSEWWRSMTSRRSTGSTCARRTWWRTRPRPCGLARRPRSGSRKWRMPRR